MGSLESAEPIMPCETTIFRAREWEVEPNAAPLHPIPL